jgi:hypothetical protein
MLELLIAYYLGGVTVSLLSEESGDGIQLPDLVTAVVWPIGAISYFYDRIKTWRETK